MSARRTCIHSIGKPAAAPTEMVVSSGIEPMTDRRPRSTEEVQAHRGASAVAPENTIAAFRAARDQGARWVELDVALLADGTPVVIHDVTLDRTTTGKGSLGDIAA